MKTSKQYVNQLLYNFFVMLRNYPTISVKNCCQVPFIDFNIWFWDSSYAFGHVEKSSLAMSKMKKSLFLSL